MEEAKILVQYRIDHQVAADYGFLKWREDSGNKRKKRCNRLTAKCNRELNNARQSMIKQERLTAKCKKRYQRAKQALLDTKGNTPRTKTRKLLRHLRVPKRVRKTLEFHHAIATDLKATYREARSERERTPTVCQDGNGGKSVYWGFPENGGTTTVVRRAVTKGTRLSGKEKLMLQEKR
ncbi:hypothetical protein LSAT2_031000 [Lamellibrachia satsuma]|nr:hypothetical protein LSAT2_031000 [Lamellibrachia satsuma]